MAGRDGAAGYGGDEAIAVVGTEFKYYKRAVLWRRHAFEILDSEVKETH